jgi:hypothetical protein
MPIWNYDTRKVAELVEKPVRKIKKSNLIEVLTRKINIPKKYPR